MLDLRHVTFLDKELFTDLARGEERELDLVARVGSRSGRREVILVHVEVEGRSRTGFDRRMFEYFMMLRLRHRCPVLPIALILSRTSATIDRPVHVDRVLGDDVCTFKFWRIGLPRLSGAEYVRRPNALAPALAALMTPGTTSRAAWKGECLRAVARARVDAARRRLLLDCIESYLPLTPRERDEFERLTRRPEDKELRRMRKLWSEQMMEIGEKRGEKRGEMRGKREALLSQLRVRFGRLPADVVRTIAAIDSARRLNALLRRVVTAPSLDQMGLSR